MGTKKNRARARRILRGAALLVSLAIILTILIIPPAGAQAASSSQTPGWTSWWAASNTTVAAALEGATRYQDTNAGLIFSGPWRLLKGAENSGGAIKYAWTPGASVTIGFNGTSLTWVAKTGPIYGKARVSVDGGAFVSVDLYNVRTRSQRPVYSTGTLADGLHTVRIEWTGQKNFMAKGSSVNIDALYVKGSLANTETVEAIKALRTFKARRPVTATTTRPTTTTTTPVITVTTMAPVTTTALAPTTTVPAPATTTTVTAPTTTTTVPAPTTTVPAPTTTVPAPTTTVPAPTTTTVPAAVRATFNLQAAIDAAAPGATITIPAGTHTGPFQIAHKTGLTLRGSAEAVLKATNADVLAIIDSADITLDGFTIVGNYSLRGQKGVLVAGLTGGVFRNLTIRDVGNSGIYANGVFTNIVISGCNITHCGDFGIHFQAGGDGVLMENCILSDFASVLYPGHGIYAKNSKNVTIRNCETSGVKHLTANGDGGIQITNCTNAQVIDCSAYGNEKYGFIVDGGVATFIRCQGQNNGVTDFYECGCATPSTYTGCTGSISRYPG